MRLHGLLAALVVAVGLMPAAALAVTTATIVATDGQQAVPGSQVQLFDTTTGAEVKQEDDDDDGAAVFLLPKGSYRVVVGGKTVQEITVTGEGAQTFTVAAGGAATAMEEGHGPEFYFGIDGGPQWPLGDEFVAGPGGSASDFPQPDLGFGGRIFGTAEFDERYMARGMLNLSRLREGFGEDSASFRAREENDIHLLWAALEFFRLWNSGSWIVGFGGGAEIADLGREFSVLITDPLGVTALDLRQESGFFGAGPRVAGFVETPPFAMGVQGFAEGGAAYLFGRRENTITVDSGSVGVTESESDSEQILHYGARIGLRREFGGPGGSVVFYGGYQFDIFRDATNTEFFPNEAFGDNGAHGPFVGIGVRIQG
jgi:hypothetical protein